MLRLLIVVAATLIIGGVVATMISRSITKPLNDTVVFANAVAAGDLDAQMPRSGGGEVGELAAAVDSMRGTLVKLLREVAVTVEMIAGRVVDTAEEVSVAAKANGDKVLITTSSRLSGEAGNLKKALAALNGGGK